MIKINNIWWRIVLVPQDDKNLYLANTDSYTLGVCDWNLKTIFLNRSLCGPKMREVLIHELLHAFSFSYNFNLSRELEEQLALIIGRYGEDLMIISKYIYTFFDFDCNN